MTKSGASFKKDVHKKCLYCDTMVWVHNKRARAVCPNWSCQLADTLEKTARNTLSKKLRKEKLRDACNSEAAS
jgi:hypothetical protein